MIYMHLHAFSNVFDELKLDTTSEESQTPHGQQSSKHLDIIHIFLGLSFWSIHPINQTTGDGSKSRTHEIPQSIGLVGFQ